MQLVELAVSTPSYVLKDAKGPIGPEVTPLEPGSNCTAIYGFSEKARYDEFSSRSEMKLAPYPLVKGYLQNQVESAGDSLMLVVVDASGFDEPFLEATTMEVILKAQMSKASHVPAEYRLAFDQKTKAYTMSKAIL